MKNLLLFIILTSIFIFIFTPLKNFAIEKPLYFNEIYNFFINNMVTKEGGVYTNYKDVKIDKNDIITKGHYILSESQSLLLEFCILNKDKDTFLKTWDFLKNYMINEDGSFVWRVSANYEKVNKYTSTLDDLHIILQLIKAKKIWPEFKEEANYYINKFVNNFNSYTYDLYLINGYNIVSKEKFLELDSSYIDLDALKMLSKYKKSIKHTYKNSLSLIELMKINDDFPFYYKTFYVTNKFINKKNDINLIETLLVCLHLAEINELDDSSLNWLQNNFDNKIFSYYNQFGQSISNVESCAIYSLISQIAYLKKDYNLYEKSLYISSRLMLDAISNHDEYNIMSYDILRVLISYSM